MEPIETTPETRAFCSACGGRLDAGARFCHQCGAPVAGGARQAASPSRGGIPPVVAWGVPALALVMLVVLVAVRSGSSVPPATSNLGGTPMPMGAAPDISSLTPEERADRLFN